MASCDYYVLNDIYEAINTQLGDIASKFDELDVSLKIDELDVDLDNLETQLTIANKLKLLDAVGTNVMTEEDQIAAYNEIKHILFPDAQDVIVGEGADAGGFAPGPDF